MCYFQVIKEFHVNTTVSHFFAKTNMHLIVTNPGQKPDIVGFHMTLLKEEFITDVYFYTEGRKEWLRGKVQEQLGPAPRVEDIGHSVVHFNLAPRYQHATVYQMNVSIEAGGRIDFIVDSLRLLEETGKGLYTYEAYATFEHDVDKFVTSAIIDPCQSVTLQEFSSKVNYFKERFIRDISSDGTMKKEKCEIEWPLLVNGVKGGETLRWAFEFKPKEQGELGKCIMDKYGYFLQVVNVPLTQNRYVVKDIIFVLDSSGSMFERKIQNVKNAMDSFLRHMHQRISGTFNIISFSDSVQKAFDTHGDWQVAADLYTATDFVSSMEAGGMADIQSALLQALEALKKTKAEGRLSEAGKSGIIIYLNSNVPSAGEQDMERLVTNITTENTERFPIFGLAYGDDAELSFMTDLSHQNFGFVRKIEDLPRAHSQISRVLEEMNGVSLRDMRITVDNERDLEHFTESSRQVLLNGHDYMFAGRSINSNTFNWSISGLYMINSVLDETFKCTKAESTGDIYTVYKYLSVQQKLHWKDRSAKQDAVWNDFVTPGTSLKIKSSNFDIFLKQIDLIDFELLTEPRFSFLSGHEPINYKSFVLRHGQYEAQLQTLPQTPGVTPVQGELKAMVITIPKNSQWAKSLYDICIGKSQWGHGKWLLFEQAEYGVKIILSQPRCIECADMKRKHFVQIESGDSILSVSLDTDNLWGVASQTKTTLKTYTAENGESIRVEHWGVFLLKMMRIYEGQIANFKLSLTLSPLFDKSTNHVSGLMGDIAATSDKVLETMVANIEWCNHENVFFRIHIQPERVIAYSV